MEDPTLERFEAILDADGPVELARAALLMGAYARPQLDVDRYLAQFDELASTAAALELTPVATIASLFGKLGLQGNSADYYDPRNSLLHDVLDRKTGIPISLSIVAIEVGRRLGVSVEGVPFPGHFMVRVRDQGEAVVLDPFANGERVDDEGLLVRLQSVTGRIGALGPDQLGAASVPQILGRMMQNLKVIYLRKEQFLHALAVQERLVRLLPTAASERRDRGLMLARLGRPLEAESDLVHYLEVAPIARDAAAVREVVGELRARRGPAN